MALRKRAAKSALAAITAVTLLTSAGAVPALAANGSNAGAAQSTAVEAAPKIVRLNASSQLFIRSVYMLNQSKGKVMAFTATVTNNGNRELDMIDYMIRVKTKSGKTFKATLTNPPASGKTVIIPPKTSQNLNYYVVVDEQTRIEDILFDIVTWDFSAQNYERKLGTIGYPFSYSEITEPFKAGVLLYDTTKFRSAIKQVMVAKDESYSYITINFLFENIGYQTMDLSRARFALQTESMTVFDLDTSDLAQITVQPRERRIVTLNAQVPASLSDRSMHLIVAIEDTTSGVRIPLGAFEMPNVKASPVTPALQPKLLYISGNPIIQTVGEAIVSEVEDNENVQSISMEYTFLNENTSTVTLPDLEFSLKDKNGNAYPLDYEMNDKRVLPKIEKTIKLTGQIPAGLNPETMQLMVRTAPSGGKSGALIGFFGIKLGTVEEEEEEGTLYAQDGYEVTVGGIQRIPTESADIVAADLLIRNVSAEHKPIPDYSGYFLINGVKINSEPVKVKVDNSISIAPGETYNLVVLAEIPYTTRIDNIQFALVDTTDPQKEKKPFRFTSKGISAIKKNIFNSSYEITGTGRRSAVRIHKAGLYDSERDKVFYVELDYENKENRTGPTVPIAGYISNADGEILHLKFSNYAGRLKSKGKVLLSGWAVLPEDYNEEGINLVIGQKVTSSAGDGELKDTVIVKAEGFVLPTERLDATREELTDLSFGKYKLSMRNVALNLRASPQTYELEGLELKFSYDLASDTVSREIAESHKLILEIVNQDTNRTTYEAEFELEKEPGTDKPKEGTGILKTIVIKDNEVWSKIGSYNRYVLNVYDQVGDQKIRLASKELRWFIINP